MAIPATDHPGQLRWLRPACWLLGILGVAAAITIAVGPLPRPAAGGTCGPGAGSESAITAFFDPGSIGAGRQPPSTDLVARENWLAFVGECQSSTDARMLLALFVLALAVAVALGVPPLVGRLSAGRRHRERTGVDAPGPASPREPYQWASGEAWGARGPPSQAPA